MKGSVMRNTNKTGASDSIDGVTMNALFSSVGAVGAGAVGCSSGNEMGDISPDADLAADNL